MRKKHIIGLIIGTILLVLCCLGLRQLDKKAEPINPTPTPVVVDQQVKDVEQLIDKITFPVTLESEADIAKAQAAYDALTDAQKAEVKNFNQLSTAQLDLAELKKQAEQPTQPDQPDNPPEEKDTTIKVGDTVNFKGGKVYYAPKDKKAKVKRGPGKCVVKYTAENKAHPYCIVSIDGGQVYGWVDADTIEKE